MCTAIFSKEKEKINIVKTRTKYVYNTSIRLSPILQTKRQQRKPPIEQVGTYDPIPNVHNEKLVSFNFERIQYWIAKGAQVSRPAAELLGLAGFLPIHPRMYMKAWRNRKIVEKSTAKESVFQDKAAVSES